MKDQGIFTGILFTFFKERYAKVLFLFTSVYYSILGLTYIGSWILLGQPYGYIKISLIIGLIIGLIAGLIAWARKRGKAS